MYFKYSFKAAVWLITWASVLLFLLLIVFTIRFWRRYGNKNKLISIMLAVLNTYLFFRIINLSIYVVICQLKKYSKIKYKIKIKNPVIFFEKWEYNLSPIVVICKNFIPLWVLWSAVMFHLFSWIYNIIEISEALDLNSWSKFKMIVI